MTISTQAGGEYPATPQQTGASLPKTLAYYADAMVELTQLPEPTQFMVSQNYEGTTWNLNLFFYDRFQAPFSAARNLLAWLDHFNADAVTVRITSVGGADLCGAELGGLVHRIEASVSSWNFPRIREALGVPETAKDEDEFTVTVAALRAALPPEGGASS